jgi:hypothetical protein
MPRYSLDETLATVKKVMAENSFEYPWEPVDVKYELVASIQARTFCIGDNGNEVYVGIARSETVPGNPRQVFDIWWNLQEELKWNTTTLKTTQLIEESGDTQVVYQDRKVHSSVSFGADVVYRRSIKLFQDHFYAWGQSVEHPRKPKNPQLRRCDIVFFGFHVQQVANDSVVLTLTSAFNELGNIPKIVIIDELKKIALRVCKVAKRLEEVRRASRGTAPAPVGIVAGPNAPVANLSGQRACIDCKTPGEGNFCGICGGMIRMM